MIPTDTNKGLDVTVEWDKNERQRARNRINQRNYRRRKSEQAKEKERQRGESSSHSPGTPGVNAHDYIRAESEMSSQSETAPTSFPYGLSPHSWQLGSSTQPEALSSLLVPPGITEGESSNTQSWDSSTNLGSPHRLSDPNIDSEDWQTARALDNQLSLSGLSTDIQGSLWSGSPDLASHARRLDLSASSSSRGKTTLHLAAENGHSQCVRVLLYHGADPNLRDSDGCTPLHVAAENGHTEVISNLIKGGCDLNVITSSGRTALHLAAENNHLEAVDQLLRAGCDPNIQIIEQ